MDFSLAAAFGGIVAVLGILQFAVAWLLGGTDLAFGFLTDRQARENFVDASRPLVWHFGVWASIVILPYVIYRMIGVCEASGLWWRPQAIFLAAAAAAIASIVMFGSYLGAKYPEGHVVDGWFSLPALLLFAQMLLALTVCFLFFLGTPQGILTPGLMWGMVGLLSIYLLLGTHLALDAVAWWMFPDYFRPWYAGGNPLENAAGLAVWLGGTAAMAAATMARFPPWQ